jgi:hypothetical protein
MACGTMSPQKTPHLFLGRGAQAASQLRFLAEFSCSREQRRSIAWDSQQTVVAILHHVRHAAGFGGDHWKTGSHGFQQD